jgi:hypothetical protein
MVGGRRERCDRQADWKYASRRQHVGVLEIDRGIRRPLVDDSVTGRLASIERVFGSVLGLAFEDNVVAGTDLRSGAEWNERSEKETGADV